MAEKYVAPKAEVVKFDSMDVICTSGEKYGATYGCKVTFALGMWYG